MLYRVLWHTPPTEVDGHWFATSKVVAVPLGVALIAIADGQAVEFDPLPVHT